MPRRPRHFLPGVPVHAIQRGNNRHACFFQERDYIIFLDKLREYSRRCRVNIHSFVLMTNHVHLLLTPDTKNGISDLFQTLGRYYVRYVNSTYRRTGTLWEGRFNASLVCSADYLLTLLQYIELNPVRARMVSHPAEYPWSSYRCHALGKPVKLLTPHPIYLGLGEDRKARQEAYRALFNTRIPELTLDQIRTAATKGWVLGNNTFKLQIEKQLGYKLPPFKRGGDRKSGKYRNS